jgi:small redox-active disulfide protein 2
MKLDVKVLGPGCAKCYALERNARAAVEVLQQEQSGHELNLQHIEDIQEISRYPVLLTPALVINEKVYCSGRIAKRDEIVTWLRKAAESS